MSDQLTLADAVQANTLGGFHDGGVSRAAALDNFPRTGAAKVRLLLAYLAHETLTDDEVAQRYPATFSMHTTAGNRRMDLMRLGLVEKAGERRPTRRGSLAEAYRLTAEGREAARQVAARRAQEAGEI